MTEMQHGERLVRRVQAARDHVRIRLMSEMQSDPEQRKRMMLSAISTVQKQAVTGTAINQVLVNCMWKVKQHKHLRQQ